MNQDRVRELFDYRSDGTLVRRLSRGNCGAGKPIGSIKGSGYLRVHVDGRSYAVHRLIWLWHHGAWPKDQIDHINMCRTDNRIENLRECDISGNCTNQHNPRPHNQLGVRGVHRLPSGKFRAQTSVRGVKVNLGKFDTAEAAEVAYKKHKEEVLCQMSN